MYCSVKARFIISFTLLLSCFVSSPVLGVRSNSHSQKDIVPIPKGEGVCKICTNLGAKSLWEVGTLITPDCVVIVRPESWEENISNDSVVYYADGVGRVFSSTIEKFTISSKKFSELKEQNFRIVFGHLSEPIRGIELPKIDPRCARELIKGEQGSQIILVGHNWQEECEVDFEEDYRINSYDFFDSLHFTSEFMAFNNAPKMAVKLCLETGKNLRSRWEMISAIDCEVENALKSNASFPSTDISHFLPWEEKLSFCKSIKKVRRRVDQDIREILNIRNSKDLFNLTELVMSDFYDASVSELDLLTTDRYKISFPYVVPGCGHVHLSDLGSGVYTVRRGETVLSGITVALLTLPLQGITSMGCKSLFGTVILPASHLLPLYETACLGKDPIANFGKRGRKCLSRPSGSTQKSITQKNRKDRTGNRIREKMQDTVPVEESTELAEKGGEEKEKESSEDSKKEIETKKPLTEILKNTCWTGIVTKKSTELFCCRELYCFSLNGDGSSIYHTTPLRDLTSFGTYSYKGTWSVKRDKKSGAVKVIMLFRIPKSPPVEFTFTVDDAEKLFSLLEARSKNQAKGEQKRTGFTRDNLCLVRVPATGVDILEALVQTQDCRGIISHFLPFYNLDGLHYEHYQEKAKELKLDDLVGLWLISLPNSYKPCPDHLSKGLLIHPGKEATYEGDYIMELQKDFGIKDFMLEKPGYSLLLTPKEDSSLPSIKLAIYTAKDGQIILGAPLIGLYGNSLEKLKIIHPSATCTKVPMVHLPTPSHKEEEGCANKESEKACVENPITVNPSPSGENL